VLVVIGWIGGAIATVAVIRVFGFAASDAMRTHQTAHLGTASRQIVIAVAETCAAAVAIAFLPSLARKTYRELGFVLPSRTGWLIAIGGAAAIYGVDVAYLLLRRALHMSPHTQKGFEHFSVTSTLDVLVVSVILCVIVPICEETVNRGFLYTALSSWMPQWLALFFNGCVFSLLHGDLALAPTFFAFGVIAALVYHRTGSIVAAMTTHGINNVVATAFLIAAAHGGHVGRLHGHHA
jgi:membrane protease YdiL (CAAX protease family)